MLESLFLESCSAWCLFCSFDHFDWINWCSLYFLDLILREASINKLCGGDMHCCLYIKKKYEKMWLFYWEMLSLHTRGRKRRAQSEDTHSTSPKNPETRGTVLNLVKIFSDQILDARNWVCSYCEEWQQQIECGWEILLVFREWRHALMKMVVPVLGKQWIRKCPCLKSLQFKGKGRHTFEQIYVIIPNKLTWVWF